MRRILSLAVFVCLSAVFAGAQIKILEKESKAVLVGNQLQTEIAVENSEPERTAKVLLEILDPNDRILARSETVRNLKRGRQGLKIPLKFSEPQDETSPLPWYRLRCRIGSNDDPQAAGIISLSEIMGEIFEIRAAATDQIFAGMNYRIRVRAVHPFSKEPVRNVRIKAELALELDTGDETEKLKLTGKSSTDSEGFAVLDFKIPPDVNLDAGELKITGEKFGVRREIDADELNAVSTQYGVYLNTDKPLYQPGQDFSVRGILLKTGFGQNTIAPERELEFQIKDEDDTLLYRETVKTSRFGVAAISWKIPDNAKLGTYRVIVDADDDLSSDQTYFKVSRYDLPQFTVSAKPDKTFYLPGDKTASVEIRADYLFGKAVPNGKTRVVRESNRRWNYAAQKWDAEIETAAEGAAGADGKFNAEIDLNDEFKKLLSSGWRRYEDLNFAVYVTDPTTNRTEQRRFDLRLTKEAIHVYLIGNTYNRNPNLPQTFYVSTFYADGSPVSADVLVKAKYEDESDWKTLVAGARTNRFGAGKIVFSAPERNDYKADWQLKIAATDAKNQSGNFDEEIRFDRGGELQIETEKTIYKPGESIKVKIVSTRKDGFVYLDAVKNQSVVESQIVPIKNGSGAAKIKYQPEVFRGELTLAVYAEDVDDEGEIEMIRAARGVIFPSPENLKFDAKFSRDEYRPNQEARINFRVLDSSGKPSESALGIVVFDKAIEERARTDAEFGGDYYPIFRNFSDLLGYGESFGAINYKDLNEIDTARNIPDDLQLAAEVMLHDGYYYPEFYQSEYEPQARKVFESFFRRQFAPVETALKKNYEKDFSHPVDAGSLRKILRENALDFDALRDPWGVSYRAAFLVDKTDNLVVFQSAGTDKKFDTRDDFDVSAMRFAYFLPLGAKINQAVLDYQKRTGKFIRDEATLKAELRSNGVSAENLRDRWNRNYEIKFEVNQRYFQIRFRSAGENGAFGREEWDSDDFDVWTNRVDYFAAAESRIQAALSDYARETKTFPKDAESFYQILRGRSIDFEKATDGFGRKLTIIAETYSRFSDRVKVENVGKAGEKTMQKTRFEPVTEQVVNFKLRSDGADAQENTPDDFDVALFSGVISQQARNDEKPKKVAAIVPTTGAKGAIRGTITDAAGAIVASAKVKALNAETAQEFSAETNEEGVFLIDNLPVGRYKVSAEAAGFSLTVLEDVPVRSQTVTEANMMLQVGAAQAVVEVSAGASTIDTSSSKVVASGSGRGYGSGNGDGIGGGNGDNDVIKIGNEKKDKAKIDEQKSTPRLREYFPETLLWKPELVTDKNGNASIKFKLADNITTWKLYALASNLEGKIGVVEREVRVFQPFFADLDPPKFLTEGDEIFLPAQIRNYTAEKQKVAVTMAKSDWFSFLNQPAQQIEIAPDQTQNAVFGFRADKFVANGKQKITAIAESASDAVEKPVTVRPNGQEIVETETKIFRRSAAFDINFPDAALPQTARAELKIYPNLLAHVTESVEGLLKRPYGCGEQTISSTYPNLMILKFTKEENRLRQKAQKYLQIGYERLLGYQTADGGFAYWSRDAADTALTAYALRFLIGAEEFIDVDESVIRRAQNYLLVKQRGDGSWTQKYAWENSENALRTKQTTVYVTRILAAAERGKEKKNDELQKSLQKAFGWLKNSAAETDEPYATANFALALLDAGEPESAKPLIEKLQTKALPEGDAVYWNLETNTPFYGWGTAGRIETTALVLQALLKFKAQDSQSKIEKNSERKLPDDELISKATVFLLKNKDRYGVWHSTQTTINVLEAFLASLSESKDQTLQIFLNGEKLKDYFVSSAQIEPVVIALNGKIGASNRVEINGSADAKLMAQTVSAHYVAWKDAEISNRNVNDSRAIRLDYKCDKSAPQIMETVSCSVEAERVGFKGYGMLLAEIGLPPGADVSRESLEKAFEADRSLSRYDVLPDRIIVYMWAKGGGSKFNFSFKPRYGISAQTPASVVYDYYNDEAKAIVAPLKFNVK